MSCESFDKVKQIIVQAKGMLGEVLSGMIVYVTIYKTAWCYPEYIAIELMDNETMELVVAQLGLVNPLKKFPFYILIETSGSDEEHDKKVCEKPIGNCVI